MATRVRSYSKINLGLAIGPVRADGFHGLATLYQTLALHDLVTVEARLTSQESAAGDPPTSKITLTTNHPQVPADDRNTAWKIVERALGRMGVTAEVAIHLEKELPVQGGLGAGSANAAAALIGLERELGFTLSELARMELASEVGSDVPLFLVGGAVLGTERGERVLGLPDLPATACVVAVPELGVSTPRAFQEWDSLCAGRASAPTAGLTGDPQPDRLRQLSHVYASVLGAPAFAGTEIQAERAPDPSGIVRGLGSESGVSASTQDSPLNGLAGNTLLALVRTGIENDFEQVVFPQYPLLRKIKRLLMGTSAGDSAMDSPDGSSGNALYAALSGSGSALFGLYRTEADARAAQRRVQASGCKAILTETLPRPEYWRNMFAE